MLQILDDTTKNLQQNWLKFMLERVGHNNLPQLLEYYENIGWISIDVADSLQALANEEKNLYCGPSWTLSPEEHRISLQYIEKLQGRHIEVPDLSISSKNANIIKADRKPRESYLEANKLEKEDLEFTINRREVTISNLESELEKKDEELGKLRDKIKELESLHEEGQTELKKNRVYREILEENTKLRKAELLRKGL